MDIGSILLVLAVILIVAGFVARPVLDRGADRDDTAATSDLVTQREAVLTELRELDFDHDTGKVDQGEYQIQRSRLVDSGAHILRALDQLKAAPATVVEDDIEQLVVARRAKVAVTSTAPTAPAAVVEDDIEQRVAARRAKVAVTSTAPTAPAVVVEDEIERLVAARRAKATAESGPACPNCRKAVQPGDKFCPHCGAKLN